MLKWLMKRLADDRGLLTMVAGLVLLVLGAAKGVTYNAFLPVDDPYGRIALGVVGLALLGWAFVGPLAGSRVIPNSDSYGIRISYPELNERVNEYSNVGGTVRKASLPKGYMLKVLRIYPEMKNALLPLSGAAIDKEKGTWRAPKCWFGNTPGEKTIGVFLIGPNGQELIRYFLDAAPIHDTTLEALRRAKLPDKIRYLPPIGGRTDDILECHRIRVQRQ
jgi:hypothetical protein